MYEIYDTTGHLIASFNSYRAAFEYTVSKDRIGSWKIKCPETKLKSTRPSTKRQQAAVRWCESILECMSGGTNKNAFAGDINSFIDCSAFLSMYLEECKDFYMEIYCEFTADRGY